MSQAETQSSALSPHHPSEGEGVQVCFEALYNWNYEPEIDELRSLYANGLERQWIALKDLDWDREIDPEAFSSTFSLGGFPIQETGWFKGLDDETRWEVSRRMAAWLLSNFLHGEQGGLLSDLGVDLDERGNVSTDSNFMTSVDGVFAGGDMQRGQSLVVHAIAGGRRTARGCDSWLMGKSRLPVVTGYTRGSV